MSCELTEEGREAVEELVECYDENEARYCDPVAREKGLFLASNEGSGRKVFSEAHNTHADVFEGSGSCVVKVGSSAGGKVQNRNEVEVTEKMEGSMASRKIAPVRDHSTPYGVDDEFVSWVTMDWVSGDVSNEEIREWRNTMRDLGWACRDFKRENFGETALGNVKMVDYGDGCRRI